MKQWVFKREIRIPIDIRFPPRIDPRYFLVAFLALLPRLLFLDHTGYWIDEMSSIHFSGHEFWQALLWDNSPPLYHFFLKIQIALFGSTEYATRTLSALFSVLATCVWAHEGEKAMGRRGFFIGALLHATFALSIYHAREARMYALFELASTLVMISYLRLFQNKPWSRARTVLALALLLSTHYLSTLPISVGLFLILVTKGRKNLKLQSLLPYFVALLISIVNLALVRWGSLNWQVLKFSVEPHSRFPFITMVELLGGPVGVLGLLVMIAVAYKEKSKPALFGLIGFLSVFAIATVAGFLMQRSVFVPRYFIYSVPFIIAGFIYALGALKPMKKSWKYAAMAATLLFVGAQSVKAYSLSKRENPPWNQAADIIGKLRGERPVRVFTTRPLSMRTPYFDKYGLEFVALDASKPDFFDPVVRAYSEGIDTWIVENYWGYKHYEQKLDQVYKGISCEFHDYTQANSSLDTIHVFRVTCPPGSVEKL